jgi:hypothetical protein
LGDDGEPPDEDIGLSNELDGNSNNKNDDNENKVDAASLYCILQRRVGGAMKVNRISSAFVHNLSKLKRAHCDPALPCLAPPQPTPPT